MLRERRLFAVLTAFLGMLVALMGCGTVEDPPWLQHKQPWVKPSPAAPKPAENNFGSVEVRKGDTLYGISRRHGLSVEAVAVANGLSPPYGLVPGQRLLLPHSGFAAANGKPAVAAAPTPPSASTPPKAPPEAVAASGTPSSSSTAAKPDKAKILPSPKTPPSSASTPPKAPSKAVAASRTPASSSTAAKPDKSKISPSPKTPPSKTPSKASPKPQRPQTQPTAPPLKPPPRSGKALTWPIRGEIIVPFGPIKEGRRNDGINIAASEGVPVKAADNGIVVYSGNELRGFGNLLLVKHDDGWMTAYAHNAELLVKRGAKVKRGQTVAKAGSTGNVRRPQLHFEVRKGSKPVDPLQYLERPPPQQSNILP